MIELCENFMKIYVGKLLEFGYEIILDDESYYKLFDIYMMIHFEKFHYTL